MDEDGWEPLRRGAPHNVRPQSPIPLAPYNPSRNRRGNRRHFASRAGSSLSTLSIAGVSGRDSTRNHTGTSVVNSQSFSTKGTSILGRAGSFCIPLPFNRLKYYADLDDVKFNLGDMDRPPLLPIRRNQRRRSAYRAAHGRSVRNTNLVQAWRHAIPQPYSLGRRAAPSNSKSLPSWSDVPKIPKDLKLIQYEAPDPTEIEAVYFRKSNGERSNFRSLRIGQKVSTWHILERWVLNERVLEIITFSKSVENVVQAFKDMGLVHVKDFDVHDQAAPCENGNEKPLEKRSARLYESARRLRMLSKRTKSPLAEGWYSDKAAEAERLHDEVQVHIQRQTETGGEPIEDDLTAVETGQLEVEARDWSESVGHGEGNIDDEDALWNAAIEWGGPGDEVSVHSCMSLQDIRSAKDYNRATQRGGRRYRDSDEQDLQYSWETVENETRHETRWDPAREQASAGNLDAEDY